MQDHTRQSLAFLHSLTGVVFAVMLLTVFWTGTLLCFDKEIDRWMIPELRRPYPASEARIDDVIFLNGEQLASAAGEFQVRRPTLREPFFQFRFNDARTGEGVILFADAKTGHPILLTSSLAATSFLFSLHYQLHLTWMGLGYWLVGLVAVGSLIVLISGIFIHRKLIDEFFVYRPQKQARRRLLDLHNITSLVALPFHVIMPLTGLYIVFAILVPLPISIAAYGDKASLERQIYGQFYGGVSQPRAEVSAEPVSIDALVRVAETTWQQRGRGDERADQISVKNLGERSSTLVVAEVYPRSAVTIGRQSMSFDLLTGRLLEDFQAPRLIAAHGWLTGLHFIQFEHAMLRWLYFLAGLCGTAMIATGLLFWLESRKRHGMAPSTAAYRVVEATTISGVTGLVAATVGFLGVNRLLGILSGSAEGFGADVEVASFFGIWLLSLLHAALRRERAWSEQLAATATAAVAAVALNWLGTGDFPWVAGLRGQWGVVGVDVGLLALSLVSARLAVRYAHHGKLRGTQAESDKGTA